MSNNLRQNVEYLKCEILQINDKKHLDVEKKYLKLMGKCFKKCLKFSKLRST